MQTIALGIALQNAPGNERQRRILAFEPLNTIVHNSIVQFNTMAEY